MRWLFIALVMCGMFFVFANVFPHFWSTRFVIPHTAFSLSYGMTALCLMAIVSVAKLHVSK